MMQQAATTSQGGDIALQQCISHDVVGCTARWLQKTGGMVDFPQPYGN
jgi:hypothetical protein